MTVPPTAAPGARAWAGDPRGPRDAGCPGWDAHHTSKCSCNSGGRLHVFLGRVYGARTGFSLHLSFSQAAHDADDDVNADGHVAALSCWGFEPLVC